MAINQTILNDFVRATVSKPSKDQESIVYGTVVIQGNREYVKLDGSELLTPIDKTVGVNDGDRARVSIKNHSATIVGNNTDPSAKGSDTASALNSIDQINSVLYQEDGTLIQVRSKFEQYDSKFEQYDSTFEQYNSTFEQYDSKFEQYDSEFEQYDSTFEQYDSKFEQVDSVLTQHNAKFTQYDSNFTQINSNFISVNSNLTTLNSDVTIINSAFKIEDGVITGLKGAVLEWLQSEYADIGFANIGDAAIKRLYADTGLIPDLTISEGHVTGRLAAVTINADTISAGSLDAKRLRILGDDGLYYILNVNSLGETTAKADPKYKSGLDGTAIIAKSLTADKVYVTDLSAFNAAIGGINITGSSIYSKTKASVNNTNPGFYLDDEGQFALGNANEYLKFYKDSSNTWKLDIQASAINTKISEAVDAITLGTYRNYVIDSENEYNSSRSSSNVVINYVLDSSTSADVRKISDSIFESPSSDFVISFYAKCSSGSSGLKVDSYLKDSAGNVITSPDDHYALTTSYKRYVIPISLKSGKTINDISVFTIRLVEGSGTVYIKKVKLESGKEASEWSQAPEDIGDRFEKTELLITETSDRLNSTITKVSGNVRTGGRNLALNSKSNHVIRKSTTYSYVTEKLPFITNSDIVVETLNTEDDYTVSFDYEIKGLTTACAPTIGLNYAAGKYDSTNFTPLPTLSTGKTNTGHYTCTTKLSAGQAQYGTKWLLGGFGEGKNANADITITNFQFEFGSRATAWAPAPEDVATADEITVLQSQIDQTPDMIALGVKSIKIGGRNLLEGTDGTNGVISFSGTFKDMSLTEYAKKLAANTEMIVSFKAKASTALYIDGYWNNGTTSYGAASTTDAFKLTTSYKSYSCVITSTVDKPLSDYLYFRIRQSDSAHGDAKAVGTVSIKELKLEVGNKATTWDMAPEEMATSAQLKITDKSIESCVKNGNVISSINQTSESIRIKAEKIDLEGIATFTNSGGRNLLKNSSFAVDYQGWTKSGAAPVEYTYTQRSCHRYSGESGVTKYLKQNIFDKIKAYSADQVYTLSAEIRVTTPFTSGDNAFVGLYTAGDYSKGAHDSTSGTSTWCGPTVISGDSPEDSQWTRLNTNSNNLAQFAGKGWKKVYIVFKIPHAATDSTDWLLDYYVYVYARDFTGNFYFRNLKLELGEWPTDWTPASDDHMDVLDYCTAGTTTINGGTITTGSIEAAQIAANAITAGKIATGAITAGKIAAGAITADKIAAGAITTDIITVKNGIYFNTSEFEMVEVDGDLTLRSTIGSMTISTLNTLNLSSAQGIKVTTRVNGDKEVYSGPLQAYKYVKGTSSGVWSYKAWEDGTVDLWCFINIDTTNGVPCPNDFGSTGMKMSDSIAVPSFPITLSSVRDVQMHFESILDGRGAIVWPSGKKESTHLGAFRLVRPDNSKLYGYVYVSVKGVL